LIFIVHYSLIKSPYAAGSSRPVKYIGGAPKFDDAAGSSRPVKYNFPPSPSERGGVSPLAFGEGSEVRWLTDEVAQLVANNNAKKKKNFFIIVVFKSPQPPKGEQRSGFVFLFIIH
jgi:hypothetical protein